MNQLNESMDKNDDPPHEMDTQNKNTNCESGKVAAIRDSQEISAMFSVIGEPSPDNRENALKWSDYGLVVTPVEPGSMKPAVDVERWPADCDRGAVDAHWRKRPSDEVAFIVGSNLIVVNADSPEAQAALLQLERTFDCWPNLTVNTPLGVEHYFLRTKGSRVPPELEGCQRHIGHIGLKTGQSFVMLPPHGGKALGLHQACSISDFPEVGQAFIDAVQRRNSEPYKMAAAGNRLVTPFHDAPTVAGVTPTMAPPVSVARENQSGEAGESGQVDNCLVAAAPVAGDRPLASSPLSAPAAKRKPTPLDRFALTGMAQAIEEQMVSSIAFLGPIALMGQFTVIFAPPNTGKTALVFAALMDSIIRGVIKAPQLYYINLDDTSKGLAEKLRIADEYGFHVVAEGYQGFTVRNFLAVLVEMIETGEAKGVIIVLDTLKKFVDVMDKKQASGFTRIMRLFVMKGGTVLALAHTNKNPGQDGKPTYAGTSDVRDDCDCAYVMRTISAQSDINQKVVEAENIKRRGDVPQTIAFSYSVEAGISYQELLSSVQMVDENQLTPLKQTAEAQSDADLIGAVQSCITAGVNTKMRLRDALVQRAQVSNRVAMRLIEKYTGSDPAAHRWTFSVRDRGAKVYVLLAALAPTPETGATAG